MILRTSSSCVNGRVHVGSSVWMSAPSLVLFSWSVFAHCRLVAEFVGAHLPDSMGAGCFYWFSAATISILRFCFLLNPERLKYFCLSFSFSI